MERYGADIALPDLRLLIAGCELACNMHDPNRPDETPATFADLKPPGYWNGEYFVEVRKLSDEEFARYMAENNTFWDCLEVVRKKRESGL